MNIYECYDPKKKFVIAKNFCPGFEIFELSGDIVRVNVVKRFADVFLEIIDKLEADENDLYPKFVNLIIHYLVSIDFVNHKNYNDILHMIYNDEIMKGSYGDDVRKAYISLTETDKKITVRYLERYNKCRGKNTYFYEYICKIFSCAVLYYQKSENKFILFIDEPENDYAIVKLQLAENLFFDIDKKIKVVWENHFGIIGSESTMRINNIQVI